MVEPGLRNRARRILKKAALGRATNIECYEELFELSAEANDPVIYAFYRTIYACSGDAEQMLSPVFAKGSEARKRLCRWSLFLKTNLEYEWPMTRLAPGLRDQYRPDWLDKLFGIDRRTARSNAEFCAQGDYHVWPFLREADFNVARAKCAQRREGEARGAS